MEKSKEIKALHHIIDELMQLLGINPQTEINYDEENEVIKINISSEENAGILIGRKGENLNALQSIVGIILKNRVGEWERIVFDINNWKEKENEKLEELANDTAQRVLETGEAQKLYNLTPAQRRIVHMKLANTKGIVTESSGEENERFLEILPSDAK